jgi:hypothetical protein
LRADAEHQRAATRALRDEISALQRALQGRNEEDTAAEVRHQLEVQGLRKEIDRLRGEVEEKGAQLDACEQVSNLVLVTCFGDAGSMMQIRGWFMGGTGFADCATGFVGNGRTFSGSESFRSVFWAVEKVLQVPTFRRCIFVGGPVFRCFDVIDEEQLL